MPQSLFSNAPNTAMPMTALPMQHVFANPDPQGTSGLSLAQDPQWHHHHPPPPNSQFHIQPTSAHLDSSLGVSGHEDAGQMPQIPSYNFFNTAQRDMYLQLVGDGTHASAPGATTQIPPDDLALMLQLLPHMQLPYMPQSTVEQDTTNENMSRFASLPTNGPSPETLPDSVPGDFQYYFRGTPSPVHLLEYNQLLPDFNNLLPFGSPDELRRRLRWIQEQTAELLSWITLVEQLSTVYARFGTHADYNWHEPLELQPVQQPIGPPTFEDIHYDSFKARLFGPNAAAAQHDPGDHPANPIIIADDSDKVAEDIGDLESWITVWMNNSD